MKISTLLFRQKDNNKMAIKFGNISMSYSAWHRASLKVSSILKKNLSNESTTIIQFLPNSIDYAIAYFAIQYINRVLVPVNIKAKSPEILSTLEYCEADLIITDSEHISFIIQCLKKYRYKIKIFNIDNFEIKNINDNCELVMKSDFSLQLTQDNVAIMLHTSGTTSAPKRVMLTHENLICNIESNIKSLYLSSKDKTLISLPMIFGYCNTAQFLTHIYLGASIIIFDGIFLPKSFFEIVHNEKITNYTCVPSILLMLLEYKYSSRYNIDSLRYICFGGGKMPIEQLKDLIIKFPNIGFVQTYGQTEASPRITALLPKDSLRKIGSVGIPIPNVEVKIVDENGIELSHNQVGEIIICGKNVMKGYYKREEATRNTIIDGWLYSGDLGYKDNEDFLYLVGRKKNIIISGGINIYPEEVEEVLMSHPNVKEALVEGKENLLLGEIPIAKIILKKDCSLTDIKQFCYNRLSEFKVPVEIIVVNDLNKTITGKISRRSNKLC